MSKFGNKIFWGGRDAEMPENKSQIKIKRPTFFQASHKLSYFYFFMEIFYGIEISGRDCSLYIIRSLFCCIVPRPLYMILLYASRLNFHGSEHKNHENKRIQCLERERKKNPPGKDKNRLPVLCSISTM